MNRYIITPIVTVLLLLALTSFISDSQGDKWITYKSKEYKFTVKFPATPNEEITEGSGGTALSVQHINEVTGQMYEVLVLASSEKIKAKQRSKSAIETFVKEVEGTVISTTTMKSGTEVVIKYGNGSFIIYHIHIVKNYMYQVIATANSPEKTATITGFFESFKISKK